MKFAIIGCGFWANSQAAGWKELEGVELVAICDPNRERLKNFQEKFKVPNAYREISELFVHEELDFVDIISSPETHEELVNYAACQGVAVICQKPMANSLDACQRMVLKCKEKKVPFFVHENFRWQTPFREFKRRLEEGAVGDIFKVRLSFCNSFPVYDNQPFLAQVEHFIIMDLGCHIIDMSRCLFGDVESIYCHITRVNPGIRGEDVANMLLKFRSGVLGFIEVSYASILQNEKFPQTYILAEGSKGSIELTKDFVIKVHTKESTRAFTASPTVYDWLDPDYAVAHSSVVPANANFLEHLKGKGKAETTGADNLKNMELVFAAYESSAKNKVINL